MSTRKTLLKPLEDRQLERERYKPDIIRKIDHIRAEYDLLARRVRKIRKEVLTSTDPITSGYRTALTDVLALIKELKK